MLFGRINTLSLFFVSILLSMFQQKILTLKYWLDFSNSEIAKKFDITTENVRVILNRAREKLKKFLSEEE